MLSDIKIAALEGVVTTEIEDINTSKGWLKTYVVTKAHFIALFLLS